MDSTSARTHRGNGSSTGAGPDQPNWRMLSAGSTRTGWGSALMCTATRSQAGGYCTGRTFPPTPHARSGRTAISATQHVTAHATGRIRCRIVSTEAAAATEYPGIASATHFWPSRNTARPPAASTMARSTDKPGPVAMAAGASTLTTASSRSGRALALFRSAAMPSMTTVSSTSVAPSAKSVVRVAGTASAFHSPPRPARAPTVPRPGSARAANGATPADCASPNVAPRAEASSHGDAVSTAVVITAAAHRSRAAPAPGTVTHANPTMAARINPVGVSPASAVQPTRAAQSAAPGGPVRNLSTAAATQGRQP